MEEVLVRIEDIGAFLREGAFDPAWIRWPAESADRRPSSDVCGVRAVSFPAAPAFQPPESTFRELA